MTLITKLTCSVFAVVFALGLVIPFPNLKAAEGDIKVGEVVRMIPAAVAMKDALPRSLKIGDVVERGEVISTGPGARLEFTLADGSVITLGEKTVFVVESFATQTDDQDSVVMRMLEGAFRATSGAITKGDKFSYNIETPVATIGVRGTTLWGGMIDGVFEIAMIEGRAITVDTKVGHVRITEAGFGTAVRSSNAVPSDPKQWAADKLQRAFSTVDF